MSYQEIPRLKSIAHLLDAIPDSLTVSHVIERFQREPSLLALPVESDGRFVGLTSRRDLFFQHLSKPFARDLYNRKPIRMLLDNDPLVMPADWDVHKGLEELLRRDHSLENDCFGVMEEGRCTGVVAVADLMVTISRIQAGLLETLENLSRRIRNEVEMARRIQADLLPATPLKHAGVAVSAGLINTTEISGDFYDLFLPKATQLGLLVADVTGHGVQAGLVTTAAKAGLQTLLDSGAKRPGELLHGMNRAILATARQQLMMTALIGLIESDADCLTLASAGHPYPWWYEAASGQWRELPLDPGFPLGFDDKATYAEYTLPFLPGDRLLLFSDGIIEAENGMAEAFGSRRFQEVLHEARSLKPDALKNRLLAAAQEFCGQPIFNDDVTLLIAEREGASTC